MKWTSIKKRLPSQNGQYLCFLKDPLSEVTQVIERTFFLRCGFIPAEHEKIITHWMPLPDAPIDFGPGGDDRKPGDGE